MEKVKLSAWAKLNGHRRSKRKTEIIIDELKNDDSSN